MLKNVTKFMFPVTVVAIKDADTLVGNIDHGFDIVSKNKTFRFYGINAYETRKNASKGIDAAHVVKGLLAKKLVQDMLTPGTDLIVESITKDEEKFGRFLGIIYVPLTKLETPHTNLRLLAVDSEAPTHFCLNDWLVREKHAVEAKY